MEVNKNNNTIQPKTPGMEEKISKMRMILQDSEKCKEIAQKLTAYIADDKK